MTKMPAPKNLSKEEAEIRASRGKLSIGQARKKFRIGAQRMKRKWDKMPDEDFSYAEKKDVVTEMINVLEYRQVFIQQFAGLNG